MPDNTPARVPFPVDALTAADGRETIALNAPLKPASDEIAEAFLENFGIEPGGTADSTARAAAAAAQSTADEAATVADDAAAAAAAAQATADEAATPQDITDALDALVNGAPGTLDTLKEIADQLADDESAVGALTASIAEKTPKVVGATDGNLALLNTDGTLRDGGPPLSLTLAVDADQGVTPPLQSLPMDVWTQLYFPRTTTDADSELSDPAELGGASCYTAAGSGVRIFQVLLDALRDDEAATDWGGAVSITVNDGFDPANFIPVFGLFNTGHGTSISTAFFVHLSVGDTVKFHAIPGGTDVHVPNDIPGRLRVRIYK